MPTATEAGSHRQPAQKGLASPAKLYVARRADAGNLRGHIQYGATFFAGGLNPATLCTSTTSKTLQLSPRDRNYEPAGRIVKNQIADAEDEDEDDPSPDGAIRARFRLTLLLVRRWWLAWLVARRWLLVPRRRLLVTRRWLLVTRRWLLIARWYMLVARWWLLVAALGGLL